jgi:hypothetical protein
LVFDDLNVIGVDTFGRGGAALGLMWVAVPIRAIRDIRG